MSAVFFRGVKGVRLAQGIYIVSTRETHRMPSSIMGLLMGLEINKSQWKDLKFNENFLAETGCRGISEYKYGGCIVTYNNDEEEEEHASESDYWSLKKAQYSLSTSDMIHICKCTTHIPYNYVVFHPETKQVIIVGSDYIKRWQGGKLFKVCQRCNKQYSGKNKFVARANQLSVAGYEFYLLRFLRGGPRRKALGSSIAGVPLRMCTTRTRAMWTRCCGRMQYGQRPPLWSIVETGGLQRDTE